MTGEKVEKGDEGMYFPFIYTRRIATQFLKPAAAHFLLARVGSPINPTKRVLE